MKRHIAIVIAVLFSLSMLAQADAQKRRRRRRGKRKPAAKRAPAKSPSPRPGAGSRQSKADKRSRSKRSGRAGKKKMSDLNFTGMDLAGRLRTPQLLYFLERASAELEAASLERRTFIPEMVRSIDEESM